MIKAGDLVKSARNLVLIRSEEQVKEGYTRYLSEGSICVITDITTSDEDSLTLIFDFLCGMQKGRVRIPYSYTKSESENIASFFIKI